MVQLQDKNRRQETKAEACGLHGNYKASQEQETSDLLR